MSGNGSIAYKSVLAYNTNITDCLRANSTAKETLVAQYKKREWIDRATTPSETELVTIVLDRICIDAGQYNIFIQMLENIAGMNLIVDKLKEKYRSLELSPPPEELPNEAAGDDRESQSKSQSNATEHEMFQSTANDHETSRREIEVLKKLQSNEAEVVYLKQIVQQRDLDLEILRQEEQSSRREIEDLKKKLQSSEAKVADLEKIGQQRDLDLKQKEQSSTREIKDLKKKLQSCEAKVADLNKKIDERDLDLKQKEQKLRKLSDAFQTEMNTLMGTETYMTKVSGPGRNSATAKQPTHVIVEATDSSNRPCSVLQKVTAKFEFISKATPTSPSGEPSVVNYTVTDTSPSQYKVSFTAVSRGQYKLHIQLQVNDKEIEKSLTITVYPNPNQLANPMRTLDGLTTPYSIGFTSDGEMIITEKVINQISIFNTKGGRIGKFKQHEDRPKKILRPQGIAIHDDNVYVSSEFKLQKFTRSGKFSKCVGQKGSKEGDFNEPCGMTLHENQLYVCDCNNHRIQVFDLDLNFKRSIGSYGKGEGEFKRPYDVKFDNDHNMYVAEYEGGRVQVLDKKGQFIRMFEENAALEMASALHIIDKYVYVSDWSGCRIVVYEITGQFVTSFGGWGDKEGKFEYPYCINSYEDQIYICDKENGRIQIF